jgi:16S rRNA (adenine1518-N6/adenine1519-N6)-dimethyltransferase
VNVRPKKSLGQHFLVDENLLGVIGRLAELEETDVVIEVGPGLGVLTRYLADRVAVVHTIELDRGLVEHLDAVLGDRSNVLLTFGDALEVDPGELEPPPRKLVANLPYNIATPLLLGWLERIREYENLTLMFQREVAERLVATPRSKSFGRLSVLVQWLAEVRILFDIPPRAFTPPPKVTSSVVHILPRAEPFAPAKKAALERITAAAFGQRRKMLRTSLKPLGLPVEPLLAAAGVSPSARAEELSIAEFCALARAAEEARGVGDRRGR